MKLPLSRRELLRFTIASASGLLLAPRAMFAWADDATKPGAGELIVRSQSPFNAEPALKQLIAAEITPVQHFYVRNHGPVPEVDAKSFRVRVEGLVNKPLVLSLEQLQKQFTRKTTEATLTCAGNRRQEMSAIKPVPGVAWDAGAIGHATWGGAILADLLAAAELKLGAKHVWFEGLDPIREKDGSVAPFGGSIPLERALAKFDHAPGALLAYEMNDRPLTPNHGFPLRAVVLGFIGARSVKWLAKIVISDRPSPNHYVAEAYKLVTSDSKDELASAEPIYGFAINSAICSPSSGAKLPSGKTTIAGYALPSGESGATIAKVELSTDGGKTWTPAKLLGPSKAFCWQRWQAEIDLPAGKHRIVVRATDNRGQTQPETCEWNLKGYQYNAWHGIAVEVS